VGLRKGGKRKGEGGREETIKTGGKGHGRYSGGGKNEQGEKQRRWVVTVARGTAEMNGLMAKGERGYGDIRETAKGGTAASGDTGGTAGQWGEEGGRSVEGGWVAVTGSSLDRKKHDRRMTGAHVMIFVFKTFPLAVMALESNHRNIVVLVLCFCCLGARIKLGCESTEIHMP